MTMQHIAANPNLGYSIIGFLHDMSEEPNDFGRFKMLGTLDDIGLVIRSMQVDEVIIALPSYLHEYAIRSVKMCERLGASFKLIPDLYEMNLSRIDMEAMEGIPLIGIKQVSLNTVQRAVTRAAYRSPIVDMYCLCYSDKLAWPYHLWTKASWTQWAAIRFLQVPFDVSRCGQSSLSTYCKKRGTGTTLQDEG